MFKVGDWRRTEKEVWESQRMWCSKKQRPIQPFSDPGKQ